ncbi:Predicted transporter component [Dorea longicatena]|nr:Predicted transporter component [Dorea longicatena]
MLIYNLVTGNFALSFNTPGVIAHSEHLWNILGMYAVGFAAVLAGGCPLRQLVLAGQGSSDSAVTVVGMFVGAALSHNLGLASSGTALNPETKEVVAGAVTANGKIAVIICISAGCGLSWCALPGEEDAIREEMKKVGIEEEALHQVMV